MSTAAHRAPIEPSGSWVAAYVVGVAYVVTSLAYFAVRLFS